MSSSSNFASSQGVVSGSNQFLAVAGAVFLGMSMLFVLGFMQGPGDALHNAAHDTRHSFAFPCH